VAVRPRERIVCLRSEVRTSKLAILPSTDFHPEAKAFIESANQAEPKIDFDFDE